MVYATVEQVADGFRPLTSDEEAVCQTLLEEAAVLIDAYNDEAALEAKQVVSCRVVRRALAVGSASVPMGATQGTMTAGPYSQSWTMSGGSTGELYIGRTEKKLLGVSDQIGCSNPLEVIA